MCPEAVSLFETSSYQAGGLSLKPTCCTLWIRSMPSTIVNGGVTVTCTPSLSFFKRSLMGWPCWC